MNITTIVVTFITLAFLAVGVLIFSDEAIAPGEEQRACTMEARECPDGSFVGRTAPNCEFAACPNEPTSSEGETSVPTPDVPVSNGDVDAVMCTMDARECADGSFVGRVAPSCAFASCPNGEPPLDPVVIGDTEITCTTDSRTADACIELYAPVCASVQVECVTTPCNPVKETYSNSCFACQEDRVLSYVEGACGGDSTGI